MKPIKLCNVSLRVSGDCEGCESSCWAEREVTSAVLVWEPGTQHTGTVFRMRSQDSIIIIPELLLIFGLQVPGIVSLILILGSCLLILATLPLSLIAVIKVVQVSLLVDKRERIPFSFSIFSTQLLSWVNSIPVSPTPPQCSQFPVTKLGKRSQQCDTMWRDHREEWEHSQ